VRYEESTHNIDRCNDDAQKPHPHGINAPTRVMPLIAFDPDISGVCSVGGTLVMISLPTKIASTKMVKLAITASLRVKPLLFPSAGTIRSVAADSVESLARQVVAAKSNRVSVRTHRRDTCVGTHRRKFEIAMV
jgi:hypothetical protein